MTHVDFRVRGSHTVTLPPERATVHATVAQDGHDAAPVFEAVVAVLDRVRSSIAERHHAKKGPIVRYTIDQVRLGSHRPWNADGIQLPLVHTAAVSIESTFTDFEELARWVAWAAGGDRANIGGLRIDGVNWHLSEEKLRKAERAARQKAVRDAARRAQDYADALGLGSVQPRGVNDPGAAAPVQHKIVMAGATTGAVGSSPEFTLHPEDVQISAEVEAHFTVHTPR